MHAPSPRAKALFVWSSAAVLVAFGLLLAGLQGADKSPRSEVLRLMPKIGAELIDAPLSEVQASWALETPQGTLLRLGDLPKDTIVFLNFWATWCPPCRDELPSMLRLRDQMADHRFMMVAVSYDDDWAMIRGFFARFLGEMPATGRLVVLRDPLVDTPEQTPLRRTFGTENLPDTYVIYNGRILARFVNARTWDDAAMIKYFKTLASLR